MSVAELMKLDDKALVHRELQLERDLMDHIHLENNVLFPRALGG